MLIEFLKPWRLNKAGAVVEFAHAGAADVLFRRGIARPAPDAPASPPPAPAPSVNGPKPKPAKPRG